MSNISSSHFPQIVFREGEKYLWNPIERKPYALRPEERVRLRVIEYLVLEAGWSKHRIATESAIQVPASEHPLRADIVVFTDDLKPHILIECKSESVQLTEQAALQTARYNTSVNAPFLLITNGLTDYWFRIKDSSFQKLKKSPLPSAHSLSEIRSDYSYWQQRGFCGKGSGTVVRKWLTETLPVFWSRDLPWAQKFLEIKQKFNELHLNHTYRIIQMNPDTRVAVSFLATAPGASYLVAILNHQQQNIGVSLTNLDMAARGEKLNTSIFSSSNTITLDARKELPLDFSAENPRIIENLPGFIYRYFEKHIPF